MANYDQYLTFLEKEKKITGDPLINLNPLTRQTFLEVQDYFTVSFKIQSFAFPQHTHKH